MAGESYAQINTMCQALIQDMKCLQMICAFRPKHFDHDLVKDNLNEIAQDFVHIRDRRNQFSSENEYLNFCSSVATLIKETAEIVQALQHREELQLMVQEEKREAMARESRPSYRQGLPPWSQFLAKGAPALPVAHFLAPLPTRPPLDPKYPLARRVWSTSTQALPQATSAILARWTWEFKSAIDYYHGVSSHIAQMLSGLSRRS